MVYLFINLKELRMIMNLLRNLIQMLLLHVLMVKLYLKQYLMLLDLVVLMYMDHFFLN